MAKIVMIGCNHAGIAAANTILGSYPGNQLVIFDRNENLSYLGCGTALWIGRQIKGYESLFYTSQAAMEAKGAALHMETEVERVDFDAKTVYAKSKDGAAIEESYDKLILATGSRPIAPPVPGLDLGNVEFVKLFQDGQKIDKILDDPSIKNVAVVGACYIGVEITKQKTKTQQQKEREREPVNSGHLWKCIKLFLREVTAREMGVEKKSVFILSLTQVHDSEQ